MVGKNDVKNIQKNGGEKNMRKEKGITLIALIITIIILVILAAVSVRAVYNMGIVGHAVNGTQQYAQAAKDENEMLDSTGSLIEEAIGKLSEIQGGNNQNTEAPDLLKDYVLGKAVNGVRPGKDYYEDLMGEDGFKTDEDSITDTNALPVYLNELWGDYKEGTAQTGCYYIRYEDVAYKIIAEYLYDSVNDIETYTTKAVVPVYTPKAGSMEGQLVDYKAKTNDTNTTKWLVLYDNGDTVDITPVNIDENWTYTLGYYDGSGDTNANGSTDLEKTQDSYENAVEGLNNYCKTIVTNVTSPNNVRSIGTGFNIQETTARYSSEFLVNNPDTEEKGNYNGVGRVGDMNAEQDVVRMSYYSAGGTGDDYITYGYAIANPNGEEHPVYWLASRSVGEYSGGVSFGVRGVRGDRLCGLRRLFVDCQYCWS